MLMSIPIMMRDRYGDDTQCSTDAAIRYVRRAYVRCVRCVRAVQCDVQCGRTILMLIRYCAVRCVRCVRAMRCDFDQVRVHAGTMQCTIRCDAVRCACDTCTYVLFTDARCDHDAMLMRYACDACGACDARVLMRLLINDACSTDAVRCDAVRDACGRMRAMRARCSACDAMRCVHVACVRAIRAR
jgi:hypothetical protein